MRLSSETRRIAREWFRGLVCLSVIIAPMAGCPRDGGSLGGGNNNSDDTPSSGLFVNENNGDKLMVAAKGSDGSAFFVFGLRGSAGGLQEVDSILVKTTDDKDAFVTFESGRPVHAQGPDGSYVHISYSNVTPTSLDASIDLKNAADGSVTNYQTTIDLRQALSDLSEQLQERTGISFTPVQVLDDGTIETGKTMHRAGVRVTIIPIFAILIVPLVAVIYAMVEILAQVVYVLFAVVAAAIQLVLVAIFSPIFLIADLLSETVIRVRFSPLITIFGVLPDEPTVIIT